MEGIRKHDHDRIVTLFDQGLELENIAEQVGCSVALASMVTSQHNRSAFYRRYPQVREWDREAILNDYKTGVPIEEIRQKHGISLTHLHRIRKAADIPDRPRPSVSGKKNGQYKHGLGGRQRDRNTHLKYQVVAACLGHVVPLGWVVHHMDENPSNNHPENLAVFPSRSAHGRYHQQLLRRQRAGLEVDASQLVLENGGLLLPQPDRPIVLPHETDRLFPSEKQEMPEPDQKACKQARA